MTDGTIQITESYEGLEGVHNVVSGGDITLVASDDGLNAAGGTDASGTGGRDAMGGYGMMSSSSGGSILISGGTLHITASGGIFIGTVASGMAQTFSSAQQGVIAVKAGNVSEGSEITIFDSKGNTLLTYTPDLAYAVVIFSSPDVITGETYTITVGTISGEIEAS